jgi:ferric-dicitrate binding protein FerR (iron transport regulator)
MKNKLWDILLKRITGNLNEDDEKNKDTLIKSNNQNERTINRLQKIWEIPDAKLPQPDIQKAFDSVLQKTEDLQRDTQKTPENVIQLHDTISNRTTVRRFMNLKLMSAAVLLLFAISLIILNNIFMTDTNFHEVYVENTDQKTITLDDGTQIILDAGSHLRYENDFNVDTRKVYFDGEGYFNVTAHPKKPFIIQTTDAMITVLGTKFNVNSWSQNNKIVVFVEEGKVMFCADKLPKSEAHKILTAGQASHLLENGYPSEPRFSDKELHLSWLNRQKYFDNRPLKDVLFQLERWYDFKFDLPDSSFLQKRVTVFVDNKPIDHIVDIIAVMNNFQYRIESRKVTFLINDQSDETMVNE